MQNFIAYETAAAYLGIFILAILPIYIGVNLCILRLVAKKKKGIEEEVEFFSFNDAKWYPVVGSVVLFSLYFVLKYVSKEIINLVLGGLLTASGHVSVCNVLVSAARFISNKDIPSEFNLALTQKKQVVGIKFGTLDVVFGILMLPITYYYVLTKHWIISNLFGLSFSISAIQMINLDSFQTGFLLLSGLFFYDVFWVFGTNVMVTVAKGLDVPIKVLFPKDIFLAVKIGILNTTGLQFSMLGLGDIVIPGVFVALCAAFDHHNHAAKSGKKKIQTTDFPKPYFWTCFIFYAAGLCTTITVMHIFKAAQPALLYLSPACIIAAFGVAAYKGQIDELFEFTLAGSPLSESQKAAKYKIQQEKFEKEETEDVQEGRRMLRSTKLETRSSSPGYLCAAMGDGMPKSLGGVLATFAHPASAAQTVAGYHNQDTVMAQMGVVKMTSTQAAIMPGMAFPLTAMTAGLDPNAPLNGLLLYATDSNGQKIGTFSQWGPAMAPFYPCSPPGTNAVVGIVHSTTLDDNNPTPNMYGGIVWNAPPVLYTQTITFTGLAVSETGFGFHSTTFNVMGAMPGSAPFLAGTPQPLRVLKCVPNNVAGGMANSRASTPTAGQATSGSASMNRMGAQSTSFSFNKQGGVPTDSAKAAPPRGGKLNRGSEEYQYGW